jgi:hypothetical protein
MATLLFDLFEDLRDVGFELLVAAKLYHEHPEVCS